MPDSPDSPQEELIEHPLEGPEDSPDQELVAELLPVPDEDTQLDLATAVLKDYQAALSDRADWEKNLQHWDEQYLGQLPEKTMPWPGCANFHVPLTMLGIETLKPRLVESVLGSDPVVFAIPTEATDEERQQRTELFLNWQILSEMKIAPQVEESADYFLNPGLVVGKVLWDTDLRRVKAIRKFPAATSLDDIFRALFGQELPQDFKSDGQNEWRGVIRTPGGAKRDVRLKFQFDEDEIRVLIDKEEIKYEAPRLHLVDPVDVAVPFKGGADAQRLPWLTQSLYYSPDAIRQKVRSGRFYKDAVEELFNEQPSGDTPLGQPAQGLEDSRSRSEGVTPDPTTNVLADEYQVLESYRRWDIDDDGLEEEIIVWVAVNLTTRILGWDYLDNVYAHGRRPYVFGRYLPRKKQFYGLSFPEVIRDIQDEINTMHNQRVDAGTIQNTPFGFFRASMTLPPQTMRVKPGEFIPIDNPQTDINIPRMAGGTVFGQNEEALLYQYFERLTGLTDLSLGRQPNRVGATRTASGTAALLSEAGLRFKTSMESFQRFWCEVFEHVLALDQQYLPPGKEFRVTGRLPEIIRIDNPQEIAGKYDLRLAATSETLNKQVMREDATVKLNAAIQSPIPLQLGIIGAKGLRRLYRGFFRAYGEQDPEMILEPDQQQVVHSPEQELAIWESGGDVEPSMMENIQIHLTVHQEQLRHPLVQQNPDLVKKLTAHLSKTMQLAQMQALANTMQQAGSRGKQSPAAGQQVQNAQTGKQAPQPSKPQPAAYGNQPGA